MTLERETPVSALGFSPDHQATEIMRDGYSLGYWIDSDWSGHGPIARLFAAAPDLMEACELFAELDNCNDQRDRLAAFDAKHGVKAGQGRYSLLFERARAAIAKATGGAS